MHIFEKYKEKKKDMKKEKIKDLIERRGFKIRKIINNDQYECTDDLDVNLFVNWETECYSFSYSIPHGCFLLKSPECSPFENEAHFNMVYQNLRAIITERLIDAKRHLVFDEFDKTYEEYKEFIQNGDWGNANDTKNFLLGLVRSMQVSYSKEMGEFVYQKVVKRSEMILGEVNCQKEG